MRLNFIYSIDKKNKVIQELLSTSPTEVFPYETLEFDSPFDLIEEYKVYDYFGRLITNDEIKETPQCFSEDEWRIYIWSIMQYVWY